MENDYDRLLRRVFTALYFGQKENQLRAELLKEKVPMPRVEMVLAELKKNSILNSLGVFR